MTAHFSVIIWCITPSLFQNVAGVIIIIKRNNSTIPPISAKRKIPQTIQHKKTFLYIPLLKKPKKKQTQSILVYANSEETTI